MSNSLTPMFEQYSHRLRSVLCLDYWQYAARLFQLPPNPDTGSVIRAIEQGHDLLQSDLVILRTLDHMAVAESANRTETAVKTVRRTLQDKAGQTRLITILGALTKEWGARVPVALSLPSPQKFLSSRGGSSSAEDRERLGMYEAEFLRSFLSCNIAGIVMEDDALPDNWEPYQSIWNLADHYGWVKGMEVAGGPVAVDLKQCGLDFLLFPEGSIEHLSHFWDEGLALGGGLTSRYWDAAGPQSPPQTFFGYGVVPQEIVPETVLRKLETWRHV